jgi:hypothetical protein
MKIPEMPDFYNINFSIHLSLLYSIEQRLWDSINHCLSVDFSRESAGRRVEICNKSDRQQEFYLSPLIAWSDALVIYSQQKTAFGSTISTVIEESKERTFVRFTNEFDDVDLNLQNTNIAAKFLLQEIAEVPIAGISWPGLGWLDDRGYYCFQPTDNALALWLKFLWGRSPASPPLLPRADASLIYVEQRCEQLLNLASITINPWADGSLAVVTRQEKALIWGLMEVYDALVQNRLHLVRAAARCLMERFLEFDRHCRLLDLDPNSAELSARAGLIVLVQRAVVELLIRLETTSL